MSDPHIPTGDPPGGGGQTQVSAATHIGIANGHGDGVVNHTTFSAPSTPSIVTPTENLMHGTSPVSQVTTAGAHNIGTIGSPEDPLNGRPSK